MSRSSNRGPRADIALLRKLKADPNFSPASLLNSGPNILEKANKLKGFVENQRGKLGASAAKTEWLLAYQQLQGEQDDAERELTSCLQQLSDQVGAEQLRDVAEVSLATLYDQAESCRGERQRLRSQVKGLSSVHGSLKAYGTPAEFSKEATALKGEMSATAQELEAALAQLAEQVAALSAELREVWPSALAGGGGGGGGEGLATFGGGVSSSVAGESVAQLQLPGYSSRSDDTEELERMMARYPLASPDVKDRIREVFAALQEKYVERLETWRLESEQAARDVAASASTSSQQQQQSRRPAVTAAGRGAPGRGGIPGPVGPGASRSPAERAGSGRGQGPAGAAAAGGGSPGPPPVAGRAAPQGPQLSAAASAAAAAAASRGVFLTGVGASSGYAATGLTAGAVENATGGAAAGPAGAGGAGWVFAGYGGWSAEEHSAFLRHRDRLMREGGAGTKPSSREALMSRIALLLPGGRTAYELMAHDDWTTAARLVGRRRRDLMEAWDRERRQFIEDSASFMQESETLFLVQAEEAAARLVAELQRVRARDDLEELRAERAREEEVAAAERAVRQAAEAEARLQAEARERRERAVKKDMVAAYRVELELLAAEQLAAAAEAERLAALAAEQQAVYNRERVEVRQAEYLEKQELAKERQAAAEAEAAAREARLARLRALVAPEVAADPERLLAPTAASAAEVDKAEGAFQPVNGYTTDQVVKDQRFKIMEALAAVGLHETTYGRQAIAAARPAKPTRPDNFTSEQREALMQR